MSLLVTNNGIELFVQISQELIDLAVFTISLKIEASELESDPAKHVLGLPVKAVHPFSPERVDKFLGFAVILLFLRIDAQSNRFFRIGELYPYFLFIIVGITVSSRVKRSIV